MNFREWLLNEIKIHYGDGDPTNFIAFKGHLWLYDPSNYDEELGTEILQIILKELPKLEPYFSYVNPDDVYDVEHWIKDNVMDSFVGEWNKDTKTIFTNEEETKSLRSSPLIKKVVDALGAERIEFETMDIKGADIIKALPSKRITGELPKVMYHGTTTANLTGILRFGLMPDATESNWQSMGIFHPDKVFLATSPRTAMFHADNSSDIQGGTPVVIAFRIPDLAKIVPDFDVERQSTTPGRTYPNFDNFDLKSPSPPFSSVGGERVVKHSGLIGYKGRIPARFIKSIRIFDGNQWRKISAENVRKVIEKYGDVEEWLLIQGIEPKRKQIRNPSSWQIR